MIDPGFLIPRDPLERVLAILIGLLMDLAYPSHSGFMLKIHPVYTSYKMALWISPPGSSRLRGSIAWLAVVFSHIAVYGSILYISYSVSKILWILVSSYIVKISIPVRLLRDIVSSIAKCLDIGDIDCARRKTSWIVRRDTRSLGEGHLASASIESLFESTVDGISSPLLYTALLGPIGGLTQRIINTLDSALGYKTPEYIEAGWLSAKADTAINYIPARLTAILIVILSPLAGGSIRRAYRIYRLYRKKTESKNAGHPMAAAAGALSVRLEKIGSYVLGEGTLPRSADIHRALRLFTAITVVLYLIAIALSYIAQNTLEQLLGS